MCVHARFNYLCWLFSTSQLVGELSAMIVGKNTTKLSSLANFVLKFSKIKLKSQPLSLVWIVNRMRNE